MPQYLLSGETENYTYLAYHVCRSVFSLGRRKMLRGGSFRTRTSASSTRSTFLIPESCNDGKTASNTCFCGSKPHGSEIALIKSAVKICASNSSYLCWRTAGPRSTENKRTNEQYCRSRLSTPIRKTDIEGQGFNAGLCTLLIGVSLACGQDDCVNASHCGPWGNTRGRSKGGKQEN